MRSKYNISANFVKMGIVFSTVGVIGDLTVDPEAFYEKFPYRLYQAIPPVIISNAIFAPADKRGIIVQNLAAAVALAGGSYFLRKTQLAKWMSEITGESETISVYVFVNTILALTLILRMIKGGDEEDVSSIVVGVIEKGRDIYESIADIFRGPYEQAAATYDRLLAELKKLGWTECIQILQKNKDEYYGIGAKKHDNRKGLLTYCINKKAQEKIDALRKDGYIPGNEVASHILKLPDITPGGTGQIAIDPIKAYDDVGELFGRIITPRTLTYPVYPGLPKTATDAERKIVVGNIILGNVEKTKQVLKDIQARHDARQKIIQKFEAKGFVTRTNLTKQLLNEFKDTTSRIMNPATYNVLDLNVDPYRIYQVRMPGAPKPPPGLPANTYIQLADFIATNRVSIYIESVTQAWKDYLGKNQFPK